MHDLILLHGALGSALQMERLKLHLEHKYNVHVFSFEGHGERSTSRPLRIQHFSENLRNYISENNLSKPSIFGYSMGGYVALHTEAHFPESFEKITTLGTKFNWSPEVADREIRMLQPDIIEEKVPKFAVHLSKIHAPNDWKENMRATAEMMENMGKNPPLNEAALNRISCPVQLLLGSKDAMVTKEETQQVLEQLQNAAFSVLEHVEHPIEKLEFQRLDGFV